MIQNIIIDSEEDSVSFEFHGPVYQANALRRIFLSEIPTLAFDHVEIRVNNTSMTDEFLTHRLRMIPIMTDSLPDEVHHFTISQKGGVLRSQDIKGTFELFPGIIVVRMREEQEFIADLYARKGIGKEDPCWSAVSNVEFRQLEEDKYHIKVNSIGIYDPRRLLDIAMGIFNKKFHP